MDDELEDWDYVVLVNPQGEYSLWPAFKDAPPGWTQTGPTGDRASCLAWVDAHWIGAGLIPRRAAGSAG